jgi:hypothetical protein
MLVDQIVHDGESFLALLWARVTMEPCQDACSPSAKMWRAMTTFWISLAPS